MTLRVYGKNATNFDTLQRAATRCNTQNMRKLTEYEEVTSVWKDCIPL